MKPLILYLFLSIYTSRVTSNDLINFYRSLANGLAYAVVQRSNDKLCFGNELLPFKTGQIFPKAKKTEKMEDVDIVILKDFNYPIFGNASFENLYVRGLDSWIYSYDFITKENITVVSANVNSKITTVYGNHNLDFIFKNRDGKRLISDGKFKLILSEYFEKYEVKIEKIHEEILLVKDVNMDVGYKNIIVTTDTTEYDGRVFTPTSWEFMVNKFREVFNEDWPQYKKFVEDEISFQLNQIIKNNTSCVPLNFSNKIDIQFHMIIFILILVLIMNK